ncbi:MAG: DUF6596 domain-containing protein [Pseudomonadota bacterium]
MSDADEAVRRRIDLLVRRGRGRLVADLVGRLGGARLDLAEDVAQEALAAAIVTWPYRGVPDNPAAWLNRVARNKAYDRLRRENRETGYDPDTDGRSEDPVSVIDGAGLDDAELNLIFLCCHPDLDEKSTLSLTLKVAGGFTAREVAGVFLEADTATGQRLARAKRRLRDLGAEAVEPPSRFDMARRLGSVLKVIYLMFALGYAPRQGEALLRRDVAMEALRLIRVLVGHRATATPDAHALAALIAFQASRFDAREADDGNPVLLADQDRGLWDQALIAEGLSHLQAAQSGSDVSVYHLEAGIAAAHALSPSWEACNWPGIVALYDTLADRTASPVVAINACVARAMAGDAALAMRDLEALSNTKGLEAYLPFHLARAEIQRRLTCRADARSAYQKALSCRGPAPVLRHLENCLAAST